MHNTNSPKPTVSSQVGTAVGLPIGLSIKMVLEVVGASGAIWGGSDVLELRNEENTEMWRQFALTVGALAFIRQGTTAYHAERLPNTQTTFFGGLSSAVNTPYEALKSQFMPKQQESQTLLTSLGR